jgi:phosphohistidine phosphatase
VHQSRRLTLVRHAQAQQAAPTDGERALTAAGQQAAAELGATLDAAGGRPDHALVSSALRARQTWEAMAAAAGWSDQPDLSQALYSAEPESALDLVREVSGAPTSVLVVGHNPTMASLAQTLDDGRGDDVALTGLLTAGFPPCAAAVFEYDGEWADLAWGGARLVDYHDGR